MEGYTWKIKGLSKGVNPDEAVEELKRLQDLHGTLNPDAIVRAAEKKSHILHPLFEWDDTRAGHRWRVQQARTLLNNIQVTVISDGEERKIDVYEVTTRNEGYKSIEVLTVSDVDYIKNSTRQQLIAIQIKLKMYSQFEKVRVLIDQAIEEMA
jgi:hypothetical protein